MGVPIDYLIFKINILKKIAIATLGICLVGLLLGQKGFSLGFLVGSLLSGAIFSLLYRYVLALKDIEPARRKIFIVPRALLIYVIMGLALAIGMKKGISVFLGTAAGFLSLKAAIYLQVFKERHASG